MTGGAWRAWLWLVLILSAVLLMMQCVRVVYERQDRIEIETRDPRVPQSREAP